MIPQTTADDTFGGWLMSPKDQATGNVAASASGRQNAIISEANFTFIAPDDTAPPILITPPEQ